MSRIRIRRTTPDRRGELIDPTTVRLSKHFMLSDFIGCNSVYSKGLPNAVTSMDEDKIAEGRYLCESLLEPLLERYGPLSIGYGFISAALSKEIVKYQDPTIPSYHMWNHGAAADIILHTEILANEAPIYTAHAIDEDYGYSRMITYSESPFICVATRLSEEMEPSRKAFYENRYMGVKGGKPLHIKKTGRNRKASSVELEHDWWGEGYPTYHGGGICQWHHKRASDCSMISDFLYSTKATQEGLKNHPSRNTPRRVFEAAGDGYDKLIEVLDIPRASIVRAFEDRSFSEEPEIRYWTDEYSFDAVLPVGCTQSADFVTNMLGNCEGVRSRVTAIGYTVEARDRTVIRVTGRPIRDKN